MKEEGKLLIFDVLIMRTELDTFETTVYRKPSASNRYILYTSAQAWKEKICAIRALKERPLEYCSNEKLLTEELNLLVNIFQQNGYRYPSNIICTENPIQGKAKQGKNQVGLFQNILCAIPSKDQTTM